VGGALVSDLSFFVGNIRRSNSLLLLVLLIRAPMVLVAKGKCSVEQIQGGKEILHETVSLLVGLIRSISPDRLGEEPFGYRTSTES